MAVDMIKALLIGDQAPMPLSPCGSPACPAGIDIVRARSLADASAQLRRRNVDVALLCLNSMDDAIADTIGRFHQEMEALPIVVISDSTDPAFAFQAISNGAQDVVSPSAMQTADFKRTILTSIERKRLEQHRIRHAREDELTGLANRLLLEERFERAMARADRLATLVALVAIDLDQPERLIELYGVGCIDRLMPHISKRLMSEIRETDTLARTRDAGFTWLVEGLAAINDISVLVDRLPRLLAQPFNLDGRETFVTVSIGVAVCPFHGRDFSTLHKLAEAAMLDVATLNGDGLIMPPLPAIVEKERSLATI